MTKCKDCGTMENLSLSGHGSKANLCKPCKAKRVREWRQTNQVLARLRSRKGYWKDRVAVFTKLGNSCERCGISDIRVLQINHKNGGGTTEWRKYSGRWEFYRAILNGKRDTKDLNILCANCNQLYEYERGQRHYE